MLHFDILRERHFVWLGEHHRRWTHYSPIRTPHLHQNFLIHDEFDYPFLGDTSCKVVPIPICMVIDWLIVMSRVTVEDFLLTESAKFEMTWKFNFAESCNWTFPANSLLFSCLPLFSLSPWNSSSRFSASSFFYACSDEYKNGQMEKQKTKYQDQLMTTMK